MNSEVLEVKLKHTLSLRALVLIFTWMMHIIHHVDTAAKWTEC